MACAFVDLNRNLFYYHKTKPKNQSDQLMVAAIKNIREKFGNLGAKKLAKLLSNEEGITNHKRVARILKENDLVIRRKRRVRYRVNNIERLALPVKVKEVNCVWSIDFMCARKTNRFKFMIFNMIDVYSRQSPGMIVERSFTSLDVTSELEKAIVTYGKPLGIITDNGVEFTSTNFRNWCKRNNIIHYLTNKASPAENSYVESFNSSVRREVLDENDFNNINALRQKVGSWREFYNKERPHGSLGYNSPENYINIEKTRKQSV